MSFSKRIGLITEKEIQMNDIDNELKNSLWNQVVKFVTNKNVNHHPKGFSEFITEHFLKNKLDDAPENIESELKAWFFKAKYNEIYDLLEFIANIDFDDYEINFYFEKEEFIKGCNFHLKKECSAYRFINTIIAPIINEVEIISIESSINDTIKFTVFEGVNTHLNRALELLSDREKPDYRNSIKESISAVETIATAISGNKKDSLQGALDKIKNKIGIHQALVQGFKSLYGYTSDADGIRHKIMDKPNCDQDDAIYMLIQCSCFVNYLISKFEKMED